ncbi:hypothetical protein F2P81_006479 [Scophthalmus maximus]|uniref:Cyclin-dependent kinase inhibitor 1C n=1 Tax=Scophthalmus maximus TaxID=52904 RepID=A0A6A4TCD6_SCOMX|nr:hypothetical protein F2P81_006479 [Scophthalmus maximus]
MRRSSEVAALSEDSWGGYIHHITLRRINQRHRASSSAFWERRTSVCRSLFGPVDHDELSQEMKAKMQEISERDQQRWNFNFAANTPLDGDYEWQEVPVDKTPAFYQDSVQNDRTRVPETPVKLRPSSDSTVPETPRTDVQERLAVPESSSTPSQVEVNQENRADKLNSGKQGHRQVPCARRKRAATTDNNNTHITDDNVKCSVRVTATPLMCFHRRNLALRLKRSRHHLVMRYTTGANRPDIVQLVALCCSQLRYFAFSARL